MHQHRADQCRQAAHIELGEFLRYALALSQAIVFIPVFAVARVVTRVHQIKITIRVDAQTQAFDTRGDDIGPAHQHRTRNAFVNGQLRGAQHALFFALGIDHALGRFFRRRKNGTHDLAGLINPLIQAFTIRIKIGDGPCRDTAVHGGLGHGRRNLRNQSRIKGSGDKVFRPERWLLLTIGGGHHIRLHGPRQFRDGAHCRQLHLGGDGGGAGIQCAAKHEREAQDIIHLIRIIRTAGGNHRIRPRFACEFGQNFRFRIGECEN